MDVLLEEIVGIGGLDVLVIGVGECCFYSRKIEFPAGRKNWAYQLTDTEIVLGDLSGIERALEEMSRTENRIVCILTCIPCLMNLDIESFIGTRFENVVCISAPDYAGISSYDCLSDLYYVLLKDIKPNPIEKVQVWRDGGKECGFADIREKLNAKTHIVQSEKFLKLLSHLSARYSLETIDDVHFHDFDFYRARGNLLGITEREIEEAEDITKKLKGLSRLDIYAPFAYEYALFLQKYGVRVRRILFDGFCGDAYARCKALKEDTEIVLYPDSRILRESEVVLDLSNCGEEISGLYGFHRLLYLLRRTLPLCR